MVEDTNMGPARKREAAAATREDRAREKRSAIRNAAYRCFATAGYHDTTVDRICETLSISKGSFYWYFRDKQAVFLNILDSWALDVDRVVSTQFASALQEPAPFPAIKHALDRELRRLRRIAPVWLEFLAHVVRVPGVRDGLRDFHRRIVRSLEKLLEPVLPEAFAEKDRRAVAVALLASFIGLVALELVDPSEIDLRAVTGHIVGLTALMVQRDPFHGTKIQPLG